MRHDNADYPYNKSITIGKLVQLIKEAGYSDNASIGPNMVGNIVVWEDGKKSGYVDLANEEYDDF